VKEYLENYRKAKRFWRSFRSINRSSCAAGTSVDARRRERVPPHRELAVISQHAWRDAEFGR